jgi:hypothetical protein
MEQKQKKFFYNHHPTNWKKLLILYKGNFIKTNIIDLKLTNKDKFLINVFGTIQVSTDESKRISTVKEQYQKYNLASQCHSKMQSPESKEEIDPTDKFVLLTTDKDKKNKMCSNFTEQDYKIENYYEDASFANHKLIRYLNYSEADVEIVPGLNYYNQMFFRATFFIETTGDFIFRPIMYQNTSPTRRFNIHHPTTLVDVEINRHLLVEITCNQDCKHSFPYKNNGPGYIC